MTDTTTLPLGSVKIAAYAAGELTLAELNRWAAGYLTNPDPADTVTVAIAQLLSYLAADYAQAFLTPMSALAMQLAQEFAAMTTTETQA